MNQNNEELSRKVRELERKVEQLNAQLKEKRFGLTWIDVPEAFEKFAKYLDGQESIEWWMKNGDTGKDWLSIRYFNEETNKKELFYPDWIYKKKDGTIGFWDTKKGRTASEVSTHNKADELQRRIKILNGYNREGIRYEGGIVIPAGGTWYYNNNEHYSFTPNSTEGWKYFKDLFL